MMYCVIPKYTDMGAPFIYAPHVYFKMGHIKTVVSFYNLLHGYITGLKSNTIDQRSDYQIDLSITHEEVPNIDQHIRPFRSLSIVFVLVVLNSSQNDRWNDPNHPWVYNTLNLHL